MFVPQPKEIINKWKEKHGEEFLRITELPTKKKLKHIEKSITKNTKKSLN